MIRNLMSGVLLITSSVVLAGQTPARYDYAAEKVTAGTVQAVVTFRDAAGTVGVHLDLQTADGFVNVHLGPATFIGQNNFWFMKDDQVEIIGVRTMDDGNVAVWVRAIQKGSALLALRNDDGTPRWTPATDGTDGCGVNHPGLPRGTER